MMKIQRSDYNPTPEETQELYKAYGIKNPAYIQMAAEIFKKFRDDRKAEQERTKQAEFESGAIPKEIDPRLAGMTYEQARRMKESGVTPYTPPEAKMGSDYAQAYNAYLERQEKAGLSAKPPEEWRKTEWLQEPMQFNLGDFGKKEEAKLTAGMMKDFRDGTARAKAFKQAEAEDPDEWADLTKDEKNARSYGIFKKTLPPSAEETMQGNMAGVNIPYLGKVHFIPWSETPGESDIPVSSAPYATPEDVRAAYRAKKLTRDQAEQILKTQFKGFE